MEQTDAPGGGSAHAAVREWELASSDAAVAYVRALAGAVWYMYTDRRGNCLAAAKHLASCGR